MAATGARLWSHSSALRSKSLSRPIFRSFQPLYLSKRRLSTGIPDSSAPISGASEALSFLQRNSIPFILLTNGGGKAEAARIDQIGKALSLRLSDSMIVQSHTPFAELAEPTTKPSESASAFYKGPDLKGKTILVVGGEHDKSQDVAHSYGFRNVVTPGDIYAAYPDIWPFSKVFRQYYSEFARPLPRPINPNSSEDGLKIDAIFVYNDPRDWGLDLQLILDLLLSREGILGTYSSKNGDPSLPNRGYQQDGQPLLYFSNPDLLWAAAYPLNRLGQGGFREALQGVWNAITHDAHLHRIQIGKPHQPTYEFAERRLIQHRNELFGLDQEQTTEPKTDDRPDGLKRVYMIGDNPESDIAGANSYRSPQHIEWKSLLVRTGVYRDREGRRPTHEPTAIVDDVRHAVRWALKDSRWKDDGHLD